MPTFFQETSFSLIPFRLYTKHGCPHCAAALELMSRKNVPFQAVDITSDPIASSGIVSAIKADVIPILVALQANEIVVGLKPNEYNRLIQNYFAGVGAVEPNVAIEGSNNPEPAAEPSKQEFSAARID